MTYPTYTADDLDTLCDHAEDLEAANVRLERENRRLREALLQIQQTAGWQENTAADALARDRFGYIRRLAGEVK